MKINEFYKPKIGKQVADVAQQYYVNRHNPNDTKNYDENLDWLKTNLKKLGWEKLDNGGFSYVFENPKKSYVLKINTYEDKGYDKFVQLIKRCRNKHFPRISDRKEMHFDSPMYENGLTYYVYLIEKLKPIPEPYDQNFSSIIASIIDIYRWQDNPNNKLMLEILQQEYDTDDYAGVYLFIKEHPSLVIAAKILGIKAQDWGVGIDMHAKNIMQRSDGTIVIIDPYV
jgi:hypothetical protein